MTVPKSDIQISVVIPAYNAGRCIARAIDSVLAQTRPAEEIIVVDDGSTDNTAAIVREYGDRIRLFQQPNAGASVARNTGIEVASCDWITFLDADDEWLPEKLRLQAEHHQCFPELKWSFTRLEWSHPEWSKRKRAHPNMQSDVCIFDDYLDAYARCFFISTITVMIHRSVFDMVGGFEPEMKRAEDNDLWFRIAYQFPQVGYVSQPLAVYHLDTPGSACKLYDGVDFMIDLVERHSELSESHHRADAFRPCIVSMLQTWMRRLVKQKRKQDALTLLNRYNAFLPGRFRREMVFRLYVPWLGSLIADTLDNLKKRWRQRRRL